MLNDADDMGDCQRTPLGDEVVDRVLLPMLVVSFLIACAMFVSMIIFHKKIEEIDKKITKISKNLQEVRENSKKNTEKINEK